MLELGLALVDVAVQLGHTDGGALVMSTYGHPSERAARARIAAAMDGNAAYRTISGTSMAITWRHSQG
jgi:hypothetical protein